jgi:hypothetical protein
MPHLLATPMRSVMKGFLVASLPGLVWLWPEGARLLLPVLVALGGMWLVTLLFRRIHSRYRGHVTGLWIMEGLLALVASVPAFLL